MKTFVFTVSKDPTWKIRRYFSIEAEHVDFVTATTMVEKGLGSAYKLIRVCRKETLLRGRKKPITIQPWVA